MLCGGTNRTSVNDISGFEVAILNADTCSWDKPSTGRLFSPVQAQASTVIGRTKVRFRL